MYDAFVQVCPIIYDVTLADTDRARDLLGELDEISARDAVHAAVMLNRGVEWVASFDRAFQDVPGIRLYNLR